MEVAPTGEPYASTMIPLSTLLAFSGAVILLMAIPGPSVLYITARSAAQGRSAGIVSVLGVHTGSLVHIVASVVGLSALVVASTAAFTAVKTVGAVYLIYLGLRTLVATSPANRPRDHARRSLRRLYLDGVIVNVLNPKVALFFLALLPQFVDPRRGSISAQVLALGAIYLVLGVMCDGLYAVVGASAGAWFRRHPQRQSAGRRLEGVALIALGVSTLAVPHRSPALST